MNQLDDKLVNWCESEFKIKLNHKDINSLMRSKNGPILCKLFEFMVNRVKSKKNGERILVCAHIIECSSRIKLTQNEINSIETIVNQLYSILANQRNKRNIVAHIRRTDQYSFNIINLLSKITEKIAVKSKQNGNITANQDILNDVVLSYRNLLSNDLQTGINTVSFNSSQHQIIPKTITEINELIDGINLHLFEIRNITINNIGNTGTIDKKNVLTILSEVCRNRNDDNIKSSNKALDVKPAKFAKIDETRASLEKALLKYREIREKHNRFKDKLVKVIDLCDAFIQDKRSKC